MKTPEQIDEEFECQKCHASVQLGDGLIPTKYCNLCAQELVESMSDRLQAVEAESKSRRKEIASLDEQLIEAKRAIETQYNLRQAVEAELRSTIELLHSLRKHYSASIQAVSDHRIDMEIARLETLLGENQPAQKDPQ